MKNNDRMTFGLLIGLINTGYQEGIVSGVVDFSKEKDINLLCFETERLKSRDFWQTGKNILFDVVDRSNVDGLIIITTALQNDVGKDAFISFLSRYHAIPMVSIGEKIAGCPSLITDNEKGLMDLFAHLVDVHSYKRLAYITGPVRNTESQIRFENYKKFLQSRNMPFDPDLVVEGDFTGVSGRQAAKALIEERKADFDVIVAANDLMALGAIEELALHGLQVPGDTFVVGFDDVAESRGSSLTTVRQPLHEQGYLAALSLFKLLNDNYDLITSIPTELIIRESCGCYSQNVSSCAACTTTPVDTSLDEALADHEGEITAEVIDILTGISPGIDKLAKGWSEKSLLALAKSCKLSSADVFIKTWNRIIYEATIAGINVSVLQSMISSFRHDLLCYNADSKQKTFLEDQLHRARIMIEEAVHKEQASRKIITEIREEKLNVIGAELASAGNLEELLNVIHAEFPSLGIKSCYLSLFENPMDRSRLVLAYNNDNRADLDGDGILFSTKDLVPESLYPKDRRYNFVIHALYHQDKNLGFIMLEMGDDVQIVNTFVSLSAKISSALRHTMLIEELVLQSQNLESFNKKLEYSNQQLQDFAFVASHDLQEPLRKINFFGERLKRKYYALLDNQGRDYLDRMQNAALRMQKLIEGLLDYSRVTTMAKPFVTVDLSQVVQGVLSDLEVPIKKTGGRVSVESLPAINADPTQMRQLFQNLIGNALKFHKPNEPPVIRVYSANDAPARCRTIIVEDNGIGIEAKDHGKIFGVFRKLHGKGRYEGSGIGLAICKKIMERHGGTIRVESRPGEGTRFIVDLSQENTY
jgi:signal transduction histidine kinase/DNA-binding LacI/PurR family transcriptional regulator